MNARSGSRLSPVKQLMAKQHTLLAGNVLEIDAEENDKVKADMGTFLLYFTVNGK